MKLLLLLLPLFLVGCFHNTKTEVLPVPTKVHCGTIAKPDPVSMLPVTPTIVIDKYDEYWVGLSFDDYENSAINLEALKGHIKGRIAQVNAYKQCVEDHNKEVKE